MNNSDQLLLLLIAAKVAGSRLEVAKNVNNRGVPISLRQRSESPEHRAGETIALRSWGWEIEESGPAGNTGVAEGAPIESRRPSSGFGKQGLSLQQNLA